MILDGADKVSRGYSPQAAPTLDSPVPRHAPVFDTGFVEEENIEHLGKGSGPTAPSEEMGRDNLLKIGGVLSR